MHREGAIMKRVVFCLLLLALLLSACSAGATYESVYTIEHGGMSFTVDMDQWTITQGEDVYHMQYDQDDSKSTVSITYPNGATYYETKQDSDVKTGHSTGYDPVRYISGEILVEVLKQPRLAKEKSPVSSLLGAVLILLGAFNIFLPEVAWRVQYGWVNRKAEPTEVAVLLSRITGVLAAFLGVILILF